MIKTYTHHSPSSLNLFCASNAMWVLEKVLGLKQPVGVPAHRGVAVEDGVTFGLMNPDASTEDCTEIAYKKYDVITALSPDERRGQYRKDIPGMIRIALDELRPYGIPSHTQGKVEWKPDGLELPIIGYFDYHWEQHNITIDLKTTERMPSAIKIPHARQIALYVLGRASNADARICYVTPKKNAVYRVDNIDEHRKALVQIAKKVERLLSLSDDPEFYVGITAPDLESFYWGGPTARALAYEYWSI